MFALVILAGCVTKNPDYTGPNTNGVPQYVVDPRINSYSNQVAGVAGMLKPVNPYAGITDYAINGGFFLAAVISGLIATKKNNAAKTSAAIADTIAAGAVKAGPAAVQTVLDHAGTTDLFGSVAALVNSNTGANQTPTGVAKTQ